MTNVNDYNIKINKLTQEQKDKRTVNMSFSLPANCIWDLQVNYLREQRQRLEKEFNCVISFSGGNMNAKNNWEVTVFCKDYDEISLLDIKMINYQNKLSSSLHQPLDCLLVLKY